jgi:hypothetical protein
LITAVLLLCELGDPLTTAGFGLRWRVLLTIAAAGRTTLGVRTATALVTVLSWINPPLAAPPDVAEPG